MAASLSEFTQALNQFQGSMRDLAVNRATNNATQQLSQINAQVKDEGEKRLALQALSNDLALRLTGLGANANQVAQAAGAVGPQQFANADQAVLEGALTGQAGLSQRGLAAKRLSEGDEASRFDRKMRLEEAKFQLDKARLEGTDIAEAQKAVNSVIEMAGLNVVKGLPGELTKDQRGQFVGNVAFGKNKVPAIAMDPKAAEQLRTKFNDLRGTNQIIDDLIKESKNFGSSFNPRARARAEALQARLKALVRIDVTGGGNVSNYEQELLDSVAANPVAIFNVTGGPQQALEQLKTAVNRSTAGILQQSGVQLLAPLTKEEQQAIAYIKKNPKAPQAEEALRLIEANRQMRGAQMALD